jgi:hypothetical protein
MAAVDPFAAYAASLVSPPTHSAPITPDDASDLATIPTRIHVGGDGNIAGWLMWDDTTDGSPRTFAVLAGTTYPYRFRRIKATGTTATGLVALWG